VLYLLHGVHNMYGVLYLLHGVHKMYGVLYLLHGVHKLYVLCCYRVLYFHNNGT